jgi:hypothetical protein
MTVKEIAKVLGVMALLVLVLLGIVAAAAMYWWKNNGTQLVAQEKASETQGKAEGALLTEKDCLDQGIVRHRKDSSLGAVMANSTRLLACLEASRQSPGFCDRVPDAGSFTASIQWRLEECKRRGLQDPNCGNLLGMVQVYCGSTVRKAKLGQGNAAPGGR